MVSYENTFKEIQEAKPEIAVLPVGSLEQHSLHLPIGTDFLMAEHLARMVAEKLGAFLLPAQPYGNSQEHQGFPGTVWISPTTLGLVVKDICQALKQQGFRKIVVINGHGANWILKPIIREINLSDPEMMVLLMGPGAASAALAGSRIELHCGKIETSRMMAAFPRLVKGKGEGFHPDVPREFLDYVSLRELSPKGVWGDPSGASAEIGRKTLDESTDAIVDEVRRTFTRLEEIKKRSEENS